MVDRVVNMEVADAGLAILLHCWLLSRCSPMYCSVLFATRSNVPSSPCSSVHHLAACVGAPGCEGSGRFFYFVPYNFEQQQIHLTRSQQSTSPVSSGQLRVPVRSLCRWRIKCNIIIK